MTTEERLSYFRAVILAVYEKEPEEARITTFDWGVMDSWLQKDIPLATILQTVKQMPKHPSIRYVKEAVELEEERRRRALS